MLTGMPETVSDDELFLHNSKPATGLVHLHGLPDCNKPDHNSISSDNDDGLCGNALMHIPTYPENSAEEASELSRSDNGICQSLNQSLSRGRTTRQGSIVDGLLHEIYDRWHYGRNDSIDSDTLTECSSTSDMFFHSRQEPGGYHSAVEKRHGSQLNRSFLQTQSPLQLQKMLSELQRSIAVMNVQLVKQLKRRDRRMAKLQRNFDIVTAVLQAASLKRQIDTRMKFSIQPPHGESAFDQWRDAMKAVCRLPTGMPPEFRKKAWLSLADHYLFQLKINWEQTIRFAFNERSNPDDEQLGMQIVKDLHRTGCSNFSGDDNDEDRAVLKRLLLAYARWNKRVGYCQGFNVIAALLLNVMDRKEDDALKVMIYLIDSVLPESYFANNLRALSVDMAVFRDLLKLTYPKLSKHLDRLQMAAQDIRTGACYEPPLTNVFTMQWFLTLFATCLPVNIVLRVWDSILLEGSEVLLRIALTIWGKLAKRIMGATSADEFYSLMGELSSSVMQGSVFDGDIMIKSIYSLGDFPLAHLNELREKYTYNIRPISQPSGSSKKNGKRNVFKSILNSDDDEIDDDDIAAMACMPGNVSSSDISVLGPGVYGPETEEGSSRSVPEMERMSTDIQSLKLQYERLKQRQKQAHIIIAAASAKKVKPLAPDGVGPPGVPAAALMPNIESPVAMNHLFLGKATSSTRNRLITSGPRISAPFHPGGNNSLLTKQLQAVANAHAVSKSKRMKTSISSKVNAAEAASLKTAQSLSASDSVKAAASMQPVQAVVSVPPVSGSTVNNITSMSAKNIQSDTAETPPYELESDLHSSNLNLHNTDFNLHSAKCPQSSLSPITNNITENTLSDLITDNECIKEIQSMQFCEEPNTNLPSQITEKELFLLNLNSDQDISCENSDSKTSRNNESDTQAEEKHDISISSGVQSIHCSADEVNSEVLTKDSRTDVSSGEISPKTLKLLTSSKSVLEDSGFASPVMMLDSMHQDIATDVVIDDSYDKENLVLIVKESSKLLNQHSHSSVIAVDHGCVSCNVNVISLPPTIDSHQEVDGGSLCQSDYNTCGGSEQLESKLFAVKATESIKEVLTTQDVSEADTPSLLDTVECPASHHKFQAGPSSMIETVPVPATLDVRKSGVEELKTIMQKSKKSSTPKQDESDQENTILKKSNSNMDRKGADHPVAISHKPSSHHKRARRLSSPAGQVLTSISTSTSGHPTLTKTVTRPFNPFPVRHFNANRAKTGLKLGLYSESTLDKLRGLKPRTSSS